MAGLTNTRSLPSYAGGEQVVGSKTTLGALGGLGGFLDLPEPVAAELQQEEASALAQVQQTELGLERGAIQTGAFGAERQDVLTEEAVTTQEQSLRERQTGILTRYLSNPEQAQEQENLEEQAQQSLPLGGFKSLLGLL